MLDTLKLQLADFSVSPESSLRVQPASFELGTGECVEQPLFSTSESVAYSGAKAYVNTDRLQFTIKPLPAGTRAVAAWLQFSVPRCYCGSNYDPVSEAETKQALVNVESELRDLGIGTNIEAADLSRVDTFQNVEPEESFSSYAKLFERMKLQRAQKRFYGTTFLLSNASQEFCVYDKLEELKARGESTAGLPATMRFEHRALAKQKVKALYGFTQAGDLFHGGYAAIREQQRESWRKALFSFEVESAESVVSANWLSCRISEFREKYGSHWLQHFLKQYGAHSLATGCKEAFREALEANNVERTQVWRAMKQLEEAEQCFLANESATETKTYRELYEELKVKVLM